MGNRLCRCSVRLLFPSVILGEFRKSPQVCRPDVTESLLREEDWQPAAGLVAPDRQMKQEPRPPQRVEHFLLKRGRRVPAQLAVLFVLIQQEHRAAADKVEIVLARNALPLGIVHHAGDELMRAVRVRRLDRHFERSTDHRIAGN